MSEKTKKPINLINDLKVIFIIIFIIFGFYKIKDSMAFPFLAISSIFILIVYKYIKFKELIISRTILNLIMAFLNVSSLFYIIHHFSGNKQDLEIYNLVFKPFMVNDTININYIIWMFLLSLLIMILQTRQIDPSGEEYDR